MRIASFVSLAYVLVFPNYVWSQNPQYTVDELTVALTEQLTSINSIYSEYEIQYGATSPVRCRAARSGTNWHYTEISDEAGVNKENTVCYDGSVVYTFIVRSSKSGQDWSTVQLHDGRERGNLYPELLVGSRLSNVQRSLPEVFEAANSVSTVLAPDGAPELVATSIHGSVPETETIAFDVHVTVAPDYGLLPRELLVVKSGDDRNAPKWKQHWKIKEYRRFKDEYSQQQRWFPVVAVLDQGPKARQIGMRVVEVRINPSLDIGLFRPNIPDGVMVSDVTSSGTNRVGIKGGDPGIDKRIAELTGAADSALGPRTRLVVILLALALPVVIVGAIYVVRRFRSS